MNRFAVLGVGISLTLCHSSWGYEVMTHQALTDAAVLASDLPNRLPDLGLHDLRQQLRTYHVSEFNSFSVVGCLEFQSFANRRSVLQIMARGAFCEDASIGTDYPGRYAFHFYDPAHGGIGYAGHSSSLTWGLEASPIATQTFSYNDAKDYLYNGITLASDVDREKNLAQMFRTLGHLVHLVQDLSQPQHTRDDGHLLGSLYEHYTNRKDVLSLLPMDGYSAVKITRPDELWHTTDNKGLADYSNLGFVTAGTNFTGTRDENVLDIQPDPNFGSPDGVGAEIVKKQITDPNLLGPLGPGQTLQGEMWFVKTPVKDSYLGSVDINEKTSTFSIFDEDLVTMGGDWTFTLNSFNFRDAHKLLIPRAVAYSAGLINHFFRGQMEVTLPDEGVYGIVDHSTGVGFKTIKLKLRNTTPDNEAMRGGTLVAVAKFHRNGCYQPDLSGEFMQDAAGTLITPCDDYRTEIEEISVSNEVNTAVDSANPQPFTFTFADPIPVNATDLYLQVVYKGTLGNEDDAVVVATKDLFEPSYLAVFNSTDYLLYNGTFLPTTDPLLLPTLDRNHDGLLDAQYDQANMKVYFGFTDSFNDAPLGTIDALPPGRFSRVVVLTDRNPYPASHHAATERGDAIWANNLNYGAETNQLDYAGKIYRVSPLNQLRGVYIYSSLTLVRNYGSQTTGGLTQLPALTDRTPYPVTELIFE